MLRRDVNILPWEMLSMIEFLRLERLLVESKRNGICVFIYLEKIRVAGFVEVDVVVG